MTVVNQNLANLVQLTSGSPASPSSTPQILALQSPVNLPNPLGIETITNGLNVPPRMVDRMSSFPSEIYSLNPTDNLVKFLKVLIGPGGAGQWRNRALQARLQTLLQGANFYQLDGFYGALFGLGRTQSEVFDINPYLDLATFDQWSEIYAQDSSYRTRIMQFALAVSAGPSAMGMKAVAEAVLQCPCAITESWVGAGAVTQTYGALESYTYGGLQAFSYGQLQVGNTATTMNLKLFHIIPFVTISQADAFGLKQVMDILKPADSVCIINTTGYETFTPITLRGVAADSSYWQMAESVIPVTKYADLYQLSEHADEYGYYQVLHPPFGEYQGEEIVYNPNVIGVAAYELDQSGNLLSASASGAMTFPDGTTLYYPPNQAIMPRFLSLSGRLVSDGILQAAPYSSDVENVAAVESVSSTGAALPALGALGGQALPQTLYVDGMALSALSEVITNTDIAGRLGTNPPDTYYWATPVRSISDQTVEVLEVRLGTAKLINNVSYNVSHLPATIEIQVYNLANSTWTTVYTQTISESVPSVVPQMPPTSHDDPLHSGPGCWQSMNLQVPATMTDRIRFRLTRLANGTPPGIQTFSLGQSGNQISFVSVPYSLAMQDVTIGYSIYQKSDLPPNPIFTSDALGSQVEWSVRQELPQNALTTGGIPWRSCPQPNANAVVNFYMDTRTALGAAQLIDRIFVDPLYVGIHCTLYYSNDVTDFLTFAADVTNLEPPQSQIVGSLNASSQGLSWDATDVNYIKIDNTAVQFNPNGPWWWGIAFSPNYFSNAAAGETLWDTGQGMALTVNPGPSGSGLADLTIKTADGQSATAGVSFKPGDNVACVVFYVPPGANEYNLAPGIYIYAGNEEEIINDFDLGLVAPVVHPIFSSFSPAQNLFGFYQPTELVTGTPTSLYIGSSVSSPSAANMELMSMVIKQTVPNTADISDFFVDWNQYVQVSEFDEIDPTGNTTNAILRFSPTYISVSNPTGMVGGPGNFWADLAWTPVLRDYVVQKGYMEFNPTLARFWKLEFTNLSAQQINSFVPITQPYQTHQGSVSSVVQPSAPSSGVGNPGNGPPGTSFNISSAQSQTLSFADSTAYVTAIYSSPSLSGPPPTATQVAVDQTMQSQLNSQGWWWQYQAWHQGQSAPRFIGTSVHAYQSSTVVQSAQVGYFAGLNAVIPYRLNFNSAAEIPIYDVAFSDNSYLQTGYGWSLNTDDLYTSGMTSLPATAVGQQIISPTSILGLQFATSQSDAVQLAVDDNFESSVLEAYNWGSTALPNVVGDATLSYLPDSQQVTVLRNYYAGVQTVTPQQQGRIVRRTVHPIFDESNLTIPIPADSEYGGLSTSWCQGFSQGYVWAAVRVTGVNLTAPLTLQIIDAGPGPSHNTPTVVASITFNVQNGQTVEQTLGYQLGSILAAGNPMFAQIIQEGNAINNQWNVQRLSLFDEGVVWKFSNDGGNTFYNAFDIRNNAFGVLSFPTPGTELVWQAVATRPGVHVHYLRIRPIYQYIPYPLTSAIGAPQGPNLNMDDHAPNIEEDPLFNGWSNPVPYWWFTNSLDYPLLTATTY